MTVCGDCAFFMVEPADPMYGVCSVEAKEVKGEEAASGQDLFTIKGSRVGRRDDTCDKFKSKKELSREERLRRSY